MKLENKSYEIGNKLVIEVVAEKSDEVGPLKDKIGVIISGGEEKTKGAKEGSEEEYSHEVLESMEFEDREHLKLFQTGLELIQTALIDEEGE